MTRFSVLLSLYAKEKPEFLNQALLSIFDQSIRADEVILVEDGPLTDELYAILNQYKETYKEFKTIRLTQNMGLGKALNEGLKHCTYDIVARMDTDDIAKPDRFEKQIKFLEDNPEYDLVGSWVDEFENDVKHIESVRKVPETSEEIYNYCKERCPVNHPTVVFKKNAVLNAGGYLTKYFPEDYFLWIRMLMNGNKFYNFQESLLYFRRSNDTIKRRGGWEYACEEIHIQWMIYKMGFITFPIFIINSIIRFYTRILPLKMRKLIYDTFLRTRT